MMGMHVARPLKGTAVLAALCIAGICCALEGQQKRESPANRNITERIAVSEYWCIYADLQRTSFQDRLTTADTTRKWVVPNPPGKRALLLLPFLKGFVVQYEEHVAYRDPSGTTKWIHSNDRLFFPFVTGSLVHTVSAGFLSRLDSTGREQGLQLVVPGAQEKSSTPLLASLPKGRFVTQTVLVPRVSDPRVETGTPRTDLSAFEQGKDMVWQRTFPEKSIPSVMTHDGKTVVLTLTTGLVHSFESETGVEKRAFDLKVAFCGPMSLGADGTLNITARQKDGTWTLFNVSLEGKVNWSLVFGNPKNKASVQPPAVGLRDRLYLVTSDTLLCVEKGTVLWREPLYQSTSGQYLTVLGDNSVLVGASTSCMLVSPEGERRWTVFLLPGDDVTAPPVVTEEGRILLGCTNNIYCY
jgi:outer membrane protein assembly factor BamB